MPQALVKRPRNEYEWNPENIARLGKISDSELAELMGGIPSVIRRKRNDLGIPAFKHAPGAKKGKPRPNFDWSEQAISLLGTKTDKEVAEQLGLCIAAVGQKRRSMSIAGLRPTQKPIEIPKRFIRYLGVWSDQKVAEKVGVSQSAVSNYRNKLGIKPLQNRSEFPQAAIALIGTMTDTDLANQLGVRVSTVQARRSKLGIARFKPSKPDVAFELPQEIIDQLGKVPDSQISHITGKTIIAIGQYRNRLGIQRYQRTGFVLPDEDHALLGVISDTDLAAKHNVSKGTIGRLRSKAGIASPRVLVSFPHEKSHLLGTMPDAKLAETLGVSQSNVNVIRNAKGIPPFRH